MFQYEQRSLAKLHTLFSHFNCIIFLCVDVVIERGVAASSSCLKHTELKSESSEGRHRGREQDRAVALSVLSSLKSDSDEDST